MTKPVKLLNAFSTTSITYASTVDIVTSHAQRKIHQKRTKNVMIESLRREGVHRMTKRKLFPTCDIDDHNCDYNRCLGLESICIKRGNCKHKNTIFKIPDDIGGLELKD